MRAQSRRTFLGSLAGASALALVGTEASLAADLAKLEIIDTHTHFYDPTRPEGIPWPSPGSKELYRRVLPADFEKLTGPLGVTGTVVVEASDRVEDNQWVLDLMPKNKVLVGLVGHLDPGSEHFKKHFARFAANPRFRGLRISNSLLKSSLDQPAFLKDLEQLAGKKLVLDVNGGPDLLLDVARLAKAVPELIVSVNHLANVAIDGKTPPADWLKGLEAVTPFKQVSSKVSALVEGAARNGKKAPSDPEFYRPVLDAAWQAFGSDRLMFGSNWPVSERAADYPTLLGIVQHYFNARGKEVAARFFAGTARHVYRWPNIV